MAATRKTKPFAVYLLFLKTGRLKTWRKLTKTKPFLRLRTSVGYEYPTYVESRQKPSDNSRRSDSRIRHLAGKAKTI